MRGATDAKTERASRGEREPMRARHPPIGALSASSALALGLFAACSSGRGVGAETASSSGTSGRGAGGTTTSAASGSSTNASSGGGATSASSGMTSSSGNTSSSSNTSSSNGGPAAPWDWVGVVGTGQSLSVGGMAPMPVATSQPYHNLKLSLGNAIVPPFNATNAAFSMVPLVEPIRAPATTYPSAYPENIYGETPHTAMGNQVTALAKGGSATDYVTVHTVVGEAGQGITVIQKGATATMNGGTSTGRAYAATLFEASAIAKLAAAAGKTYGIGAIVLTHGETDAGNAGYEAAITTLWSDYNQDLMAITGQTAKIPMLVSQYESGFNAGGVTGPSLSMLAQWQVGVDHPGDIICTGPKYQYPYYTDHIHLTNQGYDLLGEKYGEVFYEKVVLGHSFQPLQPTSIARNGKSVTLTFNVPVPPLVWDSMLPAPHQSALTQWSQGRGFEVTSGTTPLTITSVAIAGDTVQIDCSTDVPAGAVIGYAATSDGTARPGGTGRWGLLRDSDATVGAVTSMPQPDYCVTFQMTAP
jgi:hypothetical protein